MKGFEFSNFSNTEALRELVQLELIKKPFAKSGRWDPDLIAHIQTTLPDFATPEDALNTFVRQLQSTGWIRRQPSGALAADRDLVTRAHASLKVAQERRRRRDGLHEVVTAVTQAAGLRQFNVDRWLRTERSKTEGSPLSVADQGGAALDRLMRDLQALQRMVSVDGADPVDDLLGLPLRKIHARRSEERRVRRERQNQVAREEAAKAEEKSRRESAEFISELMRQARELLGSEAGDAWAESTLAEATGAGLVAGEVRLDFRLRSSLEGALWELRSKVARDLAAEGVRRDAEEAASALAARCRARLEASATQRFSFEPERSALWLRTKQLKLGMSPWSYCVDERRLHTCEQLLVAGSKATKR